MLLIQTLSYPRPLIYPCRTNHLMFSYDHLPRVCVCVCIDRAGFWLQANKANRGGGKFGGWRTLQSDAVQTRDTAPQERNASRDSWPALTHIGRIQLNKSGKVKEGLGWDGESCGGQKDTRRGAKWERCK